MRQFASLLLFLPTASSLNPREAGQPKGMQPRATSTWGSFGPCSSTTQNGFTYALDYCLIYGPWPRQWGWVPAQTESVISTFTAYTIVTVVNTFYSTTSFRTVYNDPPENFTMPATNSNGTRVTTFTFERFGTPSTTIVTYPTPFFDWPDYYGWGGTLEVTRTTGNFTITECATAPSAPPRGSPGVVPATKFYLMSNPQPTKRNIFDDKILYNLTEDPFGINYAFMEDVGSDYAPYELVRSEVFQDQVPIQNCFPEGNGPRLGSWQGDTSWLIHSTTSTIYEGSTLDPAPTATQPGNEIFPPPPPSSNPEPAKASTTPDFPKPTDAPNPPGSPKPTDAPNPPDSPKPTDVSKPGAQMPTPGNSDYHGGSTVVDEPDGSPPATTRIPPAENTKSPVDTIDETQSTSPLLATTSGTRTSSLSVPATGSGTAGLPPKPSTVGSGCGSIQRSWTLSLLGLYLVAITILQ